VPLEKGPDSDEFFLTFDKIGAKQLQPPAAGHAPAPTPVNLAQSRRSACARSTRSARRWRRSPA
jgi:hypothetical protein